MFETGIIYNKTKVIQPRLKPFSVTIVKTYIVDVEAINEKQAEEKALLSFSGREKDFSNETSVVNISLME
jgi:hypothetical protein